MIRPSATIREDRPFELLGLAPSELRDYFQSMGEKGFHGDQLYRAIYSRRLFSFDRLTEFSLQLRQALSRTASITLPELETAQRSVDGTTKYLLRLSDGQRIEAVFIPEPSRNTLCLSTQVGCPMDCRFCLTALLGFSRNLTAAEIVGQILFVQANQDKGETGRASSERSKPLNIVLMGMGEPLLNLENVVKALQLMSDGDGLAIPVHRITLSTVGLVPKIRELAQAPVIPNLAISLSATTDEIRSRLMPVNRKYPIQALLSACSDFPLPRKARLTFEYVLIDGINDTDQDARRLVRLLSGLRSKVNLLPLNLGEQGVWRPSPPQRIVTFQKILRSKGLPAFIRRPRGADIYAACGQLHRAQAARNTA
ncbi:MAG: 23S rRNA (adenine(2503)-C(2))-methyltransferase RlmN [Acidobacteriota bacterium]